MKLSIIVPCKNEEGNITELYEKINETLDKLKYEIIFVDDGSTDNTLKELKEVYEKDVQHIKILSFSRNFKKEAAMLAGLEHSIGEYTCIIDGDLQQNPKYLVDMYNYLEENSDYDVVAMVAEENEADSKLVRYCKRKFYHIISKQSNLDIRTAASDFRMFRKNVKEALISLREENRFTKGMFAWIGFNTKYMDYKVDSRKNGVTSFDLKTLFFYALNGLFGFSYKPLNWSIKLGVISILASFIYLIVVLIQTLFLDVTMKATYALILLMLLLFGIQFILLGVVGKYIALVNEEVKNRPLYIVKEKIGFSNETIL